MPYQIQVGSQVVEFPDSVGQDEAQRILSEQFPATGEDIAGAMQDPAYKPSVDDYLKYEEYSKNKQTDWINTIAQSVDAAAGMISGAVSPSARLAAPANQIDFLSSFGWTKHPSSSPLLSRSARPCRSSCRFGSSPTRTCRPSPSPSTSCARAWAGTCQGNPRRLKAAPRSYSMKFGVSKQVQNHFFCRRRQTILLLSGMEPLDSCCMAPSCKSADAVPS